VRGCDQAGRTVKSERGRETSERCIQTLASPILWGRPHRRLLSPNTLHADRSRAFSGRHKDRITGASPAHSCLRRPFAKVKGLRWVGSYAQSVVIKDCEFIGRLSVTMIRCLVIPVGGAGIVVLHASVRAQGAALIESPKATCA
jgi:hypothetical protein